MVQTAAGVARNDWVLFMKECRSQYSAWKASRDQYSAWKALHVETPEPVEVPPPRKRPKKVGKVIGQLSEDAPPRIISHQYKPYE